MVNIRSLGAVLAGFVLILTTSASCASAPKPNTGSGDVCKSSKKALNNGKQNPDGSCAETIIGEIPSQDHMISTVIRFPTDGAVLKENQPFTIRTKTINLSAGFSGDSASQYGNVPQMLDELGLVQGHSHVTVQEIGDGTEPPDPQKFVFFQALNDLANSNGELTATVDKGLSAGHYRVCTLVSTFAHTPVTMPIAKRGAQDDCVRFTVER